MTHPTFFKVFVLFPIQHTIVWTCLNLLVINFLSFRYKFRHFSSRQKASLSSCDNIVHEVWLHLCRTFMWNNLMIKDNIEKFLHHCTTHYLHHLATRKTLMHFDHVLLDACGAHHYHFDYHGLQIQRHHLPIQTCYLIYMIHMLLLLQYLMLNETKTDHDTKPYRHVEIHSSLDAQTYIYIYIYILSF